MCLKLVRKSVSLVCICIMICVYATASADSNKVYIGPFIDMRKGGNVDTTILGTIRGGFGNPLTRVRDGRGAGEFVRDQMINAARKCRIEADRKPEAIVIHRDNDAWNIENSASSDRLILVGVINQLNVQTGWSRGTVVSISLALINPATRAIVWTSELCGQDSGGLGCGMFESSAKLKQWLSDTLENAASQSLSSQDFIAAISKK